jgi:hypothetical protein
VIILNLSLRKKEDKEKALYLELKSKYVNDKTPIEELVGWMSDNESAGRISWDLAFAQCMRLMQFESNIYGCSQGWSRLN